MTLATASVAPAPNKRVHRPGLAVPERALERIRALYDEGLYVQALRAASELGELRDFSPTPARVLAARLASQLGAPRLASYLAVTAWRQSPDDAEACYYRARLAARSGGPLAALEFLRGAGIRIDATPRQRADLLLAEASALADLRDFEAAEECIARAELLSPDSAWLHVERAHVLERQDRVDEALECARRSLELRCGYRPGLQMLAHMLVQRSRDDEALELLETWASRLESPALYQQKAFLEQELGRYQQAKRSLERAIELSPLAERETVEHLSAQLSDIHCELGDVARAAELAELAGGEFYARIARRLAEPAEPRRVFLPVPWVRQNHVTCAPATLTSIAKLWGKPADHLQVVEAICYDGTPAHSERRWAEENGWETRAFTVTWDAAVALLDRGIAFTLATVEASAAHLQAVVGYDARRRTLLVRDPSIRARVEMDADAMFERYAFSGPRGMAMVPREKGELLGGLNLPDAPLYDEFDRLESALARHDRAAAAAAVSALEAVAPAHRITITARRALASYDGNPARGLPEAAELARRYPSHPLPLLDELGLLGTLGRRAERLERLREVVRKKDVDPHFWHALGVELVSDARERDTARFLLRRFVRARPMSAFGYASLADLYWGCDRRADALALYRAAACLGERDERYARSYFAAAVHLRQRDAVLAFLSDRFRRFGGKSGWPARTLFEALERSQRSRDAFAVLDEALARRPDDGELRLFAAECHARAGSAERAAELLASAEGRSPPRAFFRAAATLAECRGEISAAIEHWRAVVALEPLASDAHSALANHLAAAEGVDAALAHLEAACQRFPHHQPLHELWISWLRDHDLKRLEAALAHLVEVHPAYAWAHRERAVLFSATGRMEEAARELEAAGALDPESPSYFNVTGLVRARAGRVDEARLAYRESLRRAVDQPGIIHALLGLCQSRTERIAELGFVRDEFTRQVSFGEGVEAWFSAAAGTLPPEQLGREVDALLAQRPDLFSAWLLSARHLRRSGRREEAMERARATTAQFPLFSAAWLERGLCSRDLGDDADERTSLERAVELNPAWAEPAGELASTLVRLGEADRARQVLERACRHAPLDVAAQVRLASHLHERGRADEARAILEKALAFAPDADVAWRRYFDWTLGESLRDRALAFTRDLARRRPGSARVWLALSQALGDGDGDRDEALKALERAIALEPNHEEVHDQRALLLARAGRFDEAEAACRPVVFGDRPPTILRGRAAWLKAQRGDAQAAIAAMKAVVADEPDYAWGFLQLCIWHAGQNDNLAAAECALRLTELMPSAAEPWVRLGLARQNGGDVAGARAAFRKARELEPSWDGPKLTLFDLEIEAGELEAAAAALEGSDASKPYVAARWVQLAARQGDRDLARHHLPQALRLDDGDDWAVRTASEAMRRRGWEDDVRTWAREELERDAPNAVAGPLWAQHVSQWVAVSDEEMRWVESRGDAGVGALAAFIERLGESGARWLLRIALWLRGSAWRAKTALWSSVGHALVTHGRVRAAARWLRDWRSRADVRPWMLVNATLCLLGLRRYTEALAAAEHGLALPADHTRRRLGLLAAWLAARVGDVARARDLLGGDEPSEAFDRGVASLARALVAVSERGHEGLADAHAALVAAEAAYPGLYTDTFTRKMLWVTAWQIARRAGTFGAYAQWLSIVTVGQGWSGSRQG